MRVQAAGWGAGCRLGCRAEQGVQLIANGRKQGACGATPARSSARSRRRRRRAPALGSRTLPARVRGCGQGGLVSRTPAACWCLWRGGHYRRWLGLGCAAEMLSLPRNVVGRRTGRRQARPSESFAFGEGGGGAGRVRVRGHGAACMGVRECGSAWVWVCVGLSPRLTTRPAFGRGPF